MCESIGGTRRGVEERRAEAVFSQRDLISCSVRSFDGRWMGLLYIIFFLGCVLAFFIVGRLRSRYAFLESHLRLARKQRREVIDFLNHFSRSVATVADLEHTMQLVAHYLNDVLRAESLGIFTVDVDKNSGRKQLRGAAVAGMFPVFHGRASSIVLSKERYRLEHLRHEYIQFGEGILGTVARDERGVLISDTLEYEGREDLPRGIDTLVAVPMYVEGSLVGVICGVNCKDEGRCYREEDLRMLETLSYQAALASNLVRIYSERSRQERISQELELGREIQQSLLPAALPEWGDYRFAAFTRPALEVGGDYYDFVEIDKDRLMVVVADAAGKGVPACMLMAMCRSFVRSLVEDYAGLERFLEELSPRLFRDTDAAHFLTMAVVVIDKKTHVCEYGSAGHTSLLFRTAAGKILRITPSGAALGLLPADIGVDFETLSFCFLPGTSLMLFTDGITEALNNNEEEFGIERLQRIWDGNDLPPQALADHIVAAVSSFAGDAPQFDDQTMMVISLPGDS